MHRFPAPSAPLAAGLVSALAALPSGAALAQGAHGDATPAAAPDWEHAARTQVVAQLPRPVTSFGACEQDGWLYVLGGTSGPPHGYAREHQSDTFARLDLVDRRTWQDLAWDAGGVQSVQLAAVGGKVVAVGGMLARNGRDEPADLVSTARARLYDPLADEWSELPDLPAPRSSHDVAVVGDELFVLGGWDLGAEPRRWHSTTLRLALRPGELAWEEVEQPFQRRALATATAGGRVFAIGGIDSEGETSRRVDVLDPARGAWTRGPDFPEDAFGAAAAGVGDALFASARSGRVYRLAAGGERWERAGDLVFGRMFHRLVARPGRELLAVGGIATGAGRVSHVESLPLDPAHAGQAWTIFDLPWPGAAKSRAGLCVKGDTLYAWGGNSALEQHDFAPERFLAEGFALSLVDLRCERLPELPAPRQSFGLTALGDGGALVALGGFAHDGEVARAHGEAFRLDAEAGRWSEAAHALPTPRSQFGLVALGDEALVLGGLDYDPRRAPDDRFRHLLDGLRVGADGAPVGEPLELPRPRRAFAAAELDGHVYLVGGMREGFERVAQVDVLCLESGTWSTVPSPAAPRVSPALASVAGRLWLVGGSAEGPDGDLAPTTRIEVFDPASETWETLPQELPIAPDKVDALAWRGRLLVASLFDEHEPRLRLCLLDPIALLAAQRP